jgi:hypothetical protein
MSVKIRNIEQRNRVPSNPKKDTPSLWSHLSFTVERTDKINEKFVNLLRRVAKESIPIYSYSPDTIEIISNNTIYNADVLKGQLQFLPILDIDHKVFHLLPEEKIDGDTYKIVSYLNMKNTDAFIKFVSTDDLIVTINDKEIKDMYKDTGSIGLFFLKTNQNIEIKMTAVLGTGSMNSCWSSVSQIYFSYEDENSPIKFTMKSSGQLTEKQILLNICKYIIHYYSQHKFVLTDKYNYESQIHATSTIITINKKEFQLHLNMNHTEAFFLADRIILHKDVVFCSYPDFSDIKIVLKIIIQSGNINDIIQSIIHEIVNDFVSFEKEISKKIN